MTIANRKPSWWTPLGMRYAENPCCVFVCENESVYSEPHGDDAVVNYCREHMPQRLKPRLSPRL